VRPTISEQLAGIRRVLVDVVSPEVQGAYPVDILRGVVANLEMLERSWTQVMPFLAWDNAETARVLDGAKACVEDPLRLRIDATLSHSEPDPLDAVALDAHNTELRALLADAIPTLAAGGPACAAPYAAVRAHLRERIERFPLSMSAPMPGAKV
jgi:hypothetical protein